eukprot:TRINITY_DN16631_c0_g1_i1.p1 TRINITY_DN16631_c0_g1~~TRINITY_DN16631_c0_g1_i1.p1  ORF type:complete len:452 (-),score=99.19 TRINITY_DN16631_c0_g1_i1:21-1376(-)
MLSRSQQLKNTIYPVTPTYLYNLLQDTAIQKLVIDIRAQPHYDEGYVRTAISIPLLAPNTNGEEGSSSSSSTSTTSSFVASFVSPSNEIDLSEVDKSLNGKNKQFKSRGTIYNCVVVYDDKEEKNAKLFVDSLVKEGKFTHIHWLEGGYQRFRSVYPFLCSTLTVKARGGSFPSEIIESFMFLGSHENAKNKELLKELGITHVLNMAGELENEHPNDFQYLHVKIDDTDKDNIAQYFEHALSFIESARATSSQAKILVHCAMGISRSSSIAIAYLMKKYQWSYEKAHSFVKQARSCIKPNPGFAKQLLTYETSLNEEKVLSDGSVEHKEFGSVPEKDVLVKSAEHILEKAMQKVLAVEQAQDIPSSVNLSEELKPLITTKTTTVTLDPNSKSLPLVPEPTPISTQNEIGTTLTEITLQGSTDPSKQKEAPLTMTTTETNITINLPTSTTTP